MRHAARVEALILSCTAPKFNLTPDRIEALRAITMGRAPQAFNTDGYSPKTAKENFDVIREGWMEQIKTDPRVRYTDILACSQVDLRDAIAKIDKQTLGARGRGRQGHDAGGCGIYRGQDSRRDVQDYCGRGALYSARAADRV